MGETAIYLDEGQDIEARVRDLLSRMSLEEKASQLLHQSPAIERLGISEYTWWSEGLHGLARLGRATVFPQVIGLAACFDPDFIQEVYQAIAKECLAKYALGKAQGFPRGHRGLSVWTPNINIYRDPRWGRGQETYGEDPLLSSRLGCAAIRGLQGPDPERPRLAACAKHFAVHSGPEGLRHGFDARVSQRDLRETYLPAFKAAVEAGVESVMGAYNRVNGEVACGSPTLLRGILREEWGFKGHVVSDCWAVRDFHEHHHVTTRPEESAALAIKNGCDLNCGCTYEYLVPALRESLIDEADIDRALASLLRTRFRLGMFDRQEKAAYAGLGPADIDSQEHRQLARRAAQASMVLLKNDGVLPLASDKGYIYITGPNAASVFGLMGNYYGLNPRMVTPLEGILAALGPACYADYRPGCLLDRSAPNPVDWASFEAANCDVTIAVMGFDPSLEGEEGDAIASPMVGDRPAIELPPAQLDYLRRLRQRAKKLILVLEGGGAIAFPPDLADAVIMAWYPGEEGGNALADILFGAYNPDGRLPVSFYASSQDLPPYEDYAMSGRTYRYFRGQTLYPFGFGLGYTEFSYSKPSADGASLGPGETLGLSFELANRGQRTGTETVQLYVIKLGAEEGEPLCSLKDFRRVRLEAGQSRRLDFSLSPDMLALYGEDGRSRVSPGRYRVHIGPCAPGGRGQELGAPQGLDIEVEYRAD